MCTTDKGKFYDGYNLIKNRKEKWNGIDVPSKAYCDGGIHEAIAFYEDNVFYEEYPITGDTICDATVGGVGKLAYETLKEEGINARVVNMATIKPIDRDIIIKAAKETGAIVTAEEHSIIGGLGSAVSEALAEEYPVPVVKLGVNDTFGKSGPALELLKIFGLDAENIVIKAKKAIDLKNKLV